MRTDAATGWRVGARRFGKQVVLGLLVALFGFPKAHAHQIVIPHDYPTIQMGLDNATPGDTVLVQPGRYIENLLILDQEIVLASLYAVTGDTTYISSTILDGSGFELGGYGSVVTFLGMPAGVPPAVELSGFTITNGTGNAWIILDPAFYGGGVFCQDVHATLHHLRIRDNGGSIGGNVPLCGGGGGILLHRSTARVHHVELRENETCTPYSEAPNAGGGIFMAHCPDVTVQNVTFADNLACSAGGAAFVADSAVDFTDCLITRNRSFSTAGGLCLGYSSHVRVIACTFHGNSADYIADAIYNSTASSLHVTDTIVWGHPASGIVLDNNFWPTTTTIEYCDVEGGQAGVEVIGEGIFNWLAGNVDLDPLFVDVGAGDLRLGPGSPCIDAGPPDTTGLGLPAVDLAGLPRLVRRVDMGVYEDQATTAVAGAETAAGLSVYPNPSHGVFWLARFGPAAPAGEFGIYDCTGRRVSTLRLGARSGPQPFDLSRLESGVYFLRLGDIEPDTVVKLLLVE